MQEIKCWQYGIIIMCVNEPCLSKLGEQMHSHLKFNDNAPMSANEIIERILINQEKGIYQKTSSWKFNWFIINILDKPIVLMFFLRVYCLFMYPAPLVELDSFLSRTAVGFSSELGLSQLGS